MADKKIETVVNYVKRLQNSKNGNPRYELYTPVGVFKTGVDSGCAYVVSDSWEEVPVVLEIDGRGSVFGITDKRYN